MEISGMESGPRSYSLNIDKDSVPISVFSKNPQGKLAIEGKVDHKFEMKLKDNLEECGRLCLDRTNKSMMKNRQEQVIDNNHGAHMIMPPMTGLVPTNSKEKKKRKPVKPAEMKRTRRDSAELEDIMFKLFKRQPDWALAQLVRESKVCSYAICYEILTQD